MTTIISKPPSRKRKKHHCIQFAKSVKAAGFDHSYLADLFVEPVTTIDAWLTGKKGVSPWHISQVQLKHLQLKLRSTSN